MNATSSFPRKMSNSRPLPTIIKRLQLIEAKDDWLINRGELVIGIQGVIGRILPSMFVKIDAI